MAAVTTNTVNPDIINHIKLCLSAKEYITKYCDMNFEIEGNVEPKKDGTCPNTSDSWSSIMIHDSDDVIINGPFDITIKNGEYEYHIKNGRIYPNTEKISEKLGIKITNIFISSKIFEVIFNQFTYVVGPRFILCRGTDNYELQFTYDCVSDNLVDLNNLLHDMSIEIEFTMPRNIIPGESITPYEVFIIISSFGCEYKLSVYSLEYLFEEHLGYIHLLENKDGEFNYIFSAWNDYNSFDETSGKPKLRCKIYPRIKSEILNRLAQELPLQTNKIKFIIDVLNKYHLYNTNELHYDGTCMITKSGKKIAMPKEIYEELKDFDEDAIIELMNTKTDDISLDNKKHCYD
jgi:hypothetical protein